MSFSVSPEQARPPFVLALDVGSTGTRGGLYDATGLPIRGCRLKIPHAFTTSSDGTAVIDADQVADELRQIVEFVAASAPAPVQHARPGCGGGAGRGRADQLQIGVLAQRHPAPNAGDGVRVGLLQPQEAGRQVAGVLAGSGALLGGVLVEDGAQPVDLGGAAGVGVGVAGGGGVAVGVDADQGGGERVEGHPGDRDRVDRAFADLYDAVVVR